MASLSPQGERAILALLAEQHSVIVELREALAAERAVHAETREQLQQLRTAVVDEAGLPDPDPVAPPG